MRPKLIPTHNKIYKKALKTFIKKKNNQISFSISLFDKFYEMKKIKSLLSQMARVAFVTSIALVSGIVFYIVWQINQHKELVEITRNELQNMSEKVWHAKSGNFINAVRDNSAWDEVVDYISRDYEPKDSAWLEDNFGYMTNMYSAAMIAMYDSVGLRKYLKIENEYKDFTFFPFSFNTFKESFSDTGLVNFYIYNSGRLMEYFCSTITPSADNAHRLNPKGYMLLAREINKDLLEDFRISLGAIYTDITTEENEMDKQHFANEGFNIIITKDLNNITQNRQASMNTVFDNKVEENFAKMIPVFAIFILLCILAIGGLILFMHKKVMLPLKKISHSLASNTVEELASVKETPDEMGQVAEMLENFYIQKEELAVANKEITESINYASRIQKAAVSSLDDVTAIFPDSMIYYKPRNIISGDWYVVEELEGLKIIIEADCTGHGVPGSMLSMMGISSIKDIINSMKILGEELRPSAILNRMRTVVKTMLAQNSEDGLSINDGMDMTIGIINPETKVMKFASANQTAIIVRNGTTIKIKGDRMPIGNYMVEEDFKDFEMQLESGDSLYFMSDGIKDQTNPEREKFKNKRLEDFLIDNDNLPMSKIAKKLEKTLEDWQGNSEQVDDMTMVGVRIQ